VFGKTRAVRHDLEGTNVDAGRKILEDAAADLPTLQAASDLGDAAQKVVAAVG